MNQNNISKYTSRSASFKWWAFFVVVLGTMHVLILHSTHDAYPDLMGITVGVSIITLASAAYNHSLGNEADKFIRGIALTGMFLLVMCDLGTLFVHVMMGRDISTARAATDEYEKGRKRDLEIYRQKADVDKELLAAQANADAAAAQASRAEAARLNALPVEVRRYYAPKSNTPVVRRAPSNGASLQPTPTPAAAEGEAANGEAVVNRSEAQARANWRGWATLMLMVTLIVSFGSTFGTKVLKMADENNNNIPDYVERIYRADRSICAQLYPEYTRALDAEAQAAAARHQSLSLGNA